MRAGGHHAPAIALEKWLNALGNAGGWDGWFRRAHPELVALVWPEDSTQSPLPARSRTDVAVRAVEAEHSSILLGGREPYFNAYLMVDWSASASPRGNEHSVWFAFGEWRDGELFVSTRNCRTRAEFAGRAGEMLASRRVLAGFDFPFGYPTGFAFALGLGGSRAPPWLAAWEVIAAQIEDSPDNRNNRFEVAADFNARISGAFGPFFGRPPSVAARVERHLSAKRLGVFDFPVRSQNGRELAIAREADVAARTASSPWFLFGGENSVGSQALVGIPKVLEIRRSFADARVWPFETGATLPPPSDARVVLAEIYPSLLGPTPAGGVRDEHQVVAMACHFATLDAAGALDECFARIPAAACEEEGWILGVQEQV